MLQFIAIIVNIIGYFVIDYFRSIESVSLRLNNFLSSLSIFTLDVVEMRETLNNITLEIHDIVREVEVEPVEPVEVQKRKYVCSKCGLAKRGHVCLHQANPHTYNLRTHITPPDFYTPESPQAWNYEVEAVLGMRKKGRGYQLLIKWVGFGEEHNEWVGRSKCDCEELIQEYLELASSVQG